MLVRFYKAAQPIQFLGLVLLGVALWLIGMKFTEGLNEGMPLYLLLEPILSSNIWVARVFNLALVIGQAFLIRSITENTLPSIRNSVLPSAIFVILSFSFSHWFVAQPYIFTNLLLIALLNKVQVFYRQENVLGDSFDAGLLAGLMTLAYLPSALMFFLVWTALAVFRPFNWREWIVALMGWSFPLLMVLAWYFYFDGLGDLFMVIIPNALKGQLLDIYPYRFYLIGLGLLALPALWTFLGSMNMAGVKVNKMLSLLLWQSLFALIAWVLTGMAVGSLYFLCFPLAVMISNYLLSLRRKWIAELSLILLVIFLLYGHFSQGI